MIVKSELTARTDSASRGGIDNQDVTDRACDDWQYSERVKREVGDRDEKMPSRAGREDYVASGIRWLGVEDPQKRRGLLYGSLWTRLIGRAST